MKKLANFVFIIISIFISVFCIHTIYNNDTEIKKYVLNDINEKIDFIGSSARNISINFNKTGVIKLNALYKGAHGESNPSDFSYNFSSSDENISIENSDGYMDFNISKVVDVINTLSSLKTIEPEMIISSKNRIDDIKYILDKDIINDVYGVSFKNISIDIKTEGFIKKVKTYSINLDDIEICVTDKKIVVSGKNSITFTIGDKGYSLNINDKLKMNVIDENKYNILINGTSLFLELNEKSFYISALSSHAIYNSLEINGTFENVNLDRNNIADKSLNPIYRYFSEVSFDIWS